ncbi:hypothetical protein E4U09_007011 [Claviceps aff. purpurea]|uniref:Uncharacterized protein n=1 Tax=Claviceps aff. purpurea TaxID=1967640 RepID=A0A9P7U547_9HYPO|nr:hypothetical protein E4U09_007011 [Claviceps aff. purpurea]
MVTRSAAAAAPQSAFVQLSPTSPSQSSVSSAEESAWQAPGVETWGSSSDDDDDDDDDDDNENNDDDDDDDDEDDDNTDNDTDEYTEDGSKASVPEVVDRSLQTDRAASETKPPARPQMSNTRRIIWAHQAWLNKKNSGTATVAAATAAAASGVGNGHGTTTALPGASSSKTQTPVAPPPEPLKAPTEGRSGSPIKRLPNGGVDTPQVPSPALMKQGLADTAATKPPSAPVTPVPQKKSPAASASKSPAVSVDGKGTSNPAQPKNLGHFLLASNNMPYTVWVDPNGTPVPARGALLPAEYKLHDDPDFPFICPIRSCRRTLPNLFALGGHFNAGHSHVQVHDNLDGTFTQLGTYTNTTGSHPCIVVSKGPPPPGALPPVEPRLPDTQHKNKRHLPYVGGGRAKRQMIRTSTQMRAAQRQAKLAPEQAPVEQPREQARFAPDLSSQQAPSRDVATGPGIPYTSTASPVSPPQTVTQAAPTPGQYGPGSIRQSILARLRADKYSSRALSQSTQGAVARLEAVEDVSGERPDACSPNAQSIAARLQADKEALGERLHTDSPSAQGVVAQSIAARLQADKEALGERLHTDSPSAQGIVAQMQAGKDVSGERPHEDSPKAETIVVRLQANRDVSGERPHTCSRIAQSVMARLEADKDASGERSHTRSPSAQGVMARLEVDKDVSSERPYTRSPSAQGVMARLQADKDVSGERPYTRSPSPSAQDVVARLQADKGVSSERPHTRSSSAQSIMARLEADKDVSGERSHTRSPSAQGVVARLQADKEVSGEQPDRCSSNAQSIVARLEADKGESGERPHTRSPSTQGVMARLEADKGVSSERPYTRSPSAQGVVAHLEADKDVSSERPCTRSPSAQGVVARLEADKDVSGERPHTRSPSAQGVAARLQADKIVSGKPPDTCSSNAQNMVARLQADKGVSSERPYTRSPSARQTQQGAPPPESPLNDSSEQHAPEQANLEMESWEIAPGRVTSKDSLQNVAFSGTFLASSKPIVVCSDIAFNVLTIRPGQSHHTVVQHDMMQLYSVASGKVHITTGGVSVALGPNGMFPVRGGERCVVENRLYSEATLHCTTVPDSGYS